MTIEYETTISSTICTTLETYLKTKLNLKIKQNKFLHRNKERLDLAVFSAYDISDSYMRFSVAVNGIHIPNATISIPLSQLFKYEKIHNIWKLGDKLCTTLYMHFGICDSASNSESNIVNNPSNTVDNRKPILCTCCGSPLQPPFNHCDFCNVFYENT